MINYYQVTITINHQTNVFLQVPGSESWEFPKQYKSKKDRKLNNLQIKGVLPLSSYNRFQILLEEADMKYYVEQNDKQIIGEIEAFHAETETENNHLFKSENRSSSCYSRLEKDCKKITSRSAETKDLLLASKSLLKKCRWCAFKKRSCVLDRTLCTAFEKKCYRCSKTGHFPRSLNCKKRNAKRLEDFKSKNISVNYDSNICMQYVVADGQIEEIFDDIEILEDYLEVSGSNKKNNILQIDGFEDIMQKEFFEVEKKCLELIVNLIL